MTQFTVSRRAVLGGAASALLVPAAAHATTPARHYDEMTDVLIVGSGFAGMAAALAAAEKGVKVKGSSSKTPSLRDGASRFV